MESRIPTLASPVASAFPVEEDPRKIWQVFADHFYLYNATPTGLWIRDELSEVFGIDEPLNSQNAQSIYDSINQALAKADCTPRKLYHRFNIAVLSTTDSPSDDLLAHRQIAADWGGHILPTFRADLIVHIDRSEWLLEIENWQPPVGSKFMISLPTWRPLNPVDDSSKTSEPQRPTWPW